MPASSLRALLGLAVMILVSAPTAEANTRFWSFDLKGGTNKVVSTQVIGQDQGVQYGIRALEGVA